MSTAESTAADPELETAAPGVWFRPKGNLTRSELGVLLCVAIVPLVIVAIRVLSLPDVLGPDLSGTWLKALGNELRDMLSLSEVPANDRNRVLYMLFLPTSALLIAIARLTLGVRVIGFRAILISVGFQQSGMIPSLILILVVVFIIMMVRPALRRIRLPQVARISVIMSIGVIVLISAMLIAPWTRSEVLWSVAFFPVIVLGLLAESIAKTLDQTSGIVAVWRAGMTIGIAMLLAGISQVPVLREVVIQYPELVLTQLVMIIFVSEYFDLRLFQDWDSRLSGVAVPRLFGQRPGLRVAIVRNRRTNGVIAKLGTPTRPGYGRRDVRRIASMLRARGHTVERFEGDMTMLSRLREFLPPHPRSGEPGGLVLNLASGIQGDSAAGHVPAMLEMAGVAYAGATPLGHALLQDRWMLNQALRAASVQVPSLRVVQGEGAAIDGLTYPVLVKSRQTGVARSQVVRDRERLDGAIRKILRRGASEVLVEQFVPGRQIEVALIGNDPIECLPPIEVLAGEEDPMRPANVDVGVAAEIRDAAVAAFRACSCRDAARVVLRLSRGGTVHVVGVESLGGLEEGGLFERASEAAGSSLAESIERILLAAAARYRTIRAAAPLSVVPGPESAPRTQGRPVIAGS